MNFSPHEYQRSAIQFFMSNDHAALFADPGSGKTAITLSVIKQRKCTALIVAPLRVCYSVWPQEAEKWETGLSVSVLHGPKKRQALNSAADIYVINPEGLKWYFENAYMLPEMLVIDESSKFKAWSSMRMKLLKKHLPSFKYRYILTGTPTPHSLLDLFSQMYIVDMGKLLGKAITHYRTAYFEPYGFENRQWRIRKGMDQMIYNRIAPNILRIDSTTFLDLPDCTINDVFISLGKKERTLYLELEKEFFSEWNGKELSLNSSGSKYLSCRQVANGQVYTATGSQDYIVIHRQKFDALVDLIDELQGKPVLIAYNFRNELAELRKLYPKAPVIGGGEKGDINQIVADWNKGKIHVLLANPQAMAHGLNMQEGGHDIIWFSLTDNQEDYAQFNKRIHRQGVKKQVRIHRLIAKGTVETAIAKRLESKTSGQQALLNALRDYRSLSGEIRDYCRNC